MGQEMLKKVVSEKKVVVGIAGAVVLVAVLMGAISLITAWEKGGPKAERNQQEQAGRQSDRTTDMEAARRRMEDRRRERRRLRSRENGLMREGFDEWLNEITTAYQEKDMEKMGQLLEKMQRDRQRLRERRRAYMERRRDLRDSADAGKRQASEMKEEQFERVEVQPGQP